MDNLRREYIVFQSEWKDIVTFQQWFESMEQVWKQKARVSNTLCHLRLDIDVEIRKRLSLTVGIMPSSVNNRGLRRLRVPSSTRQDTKRNILTYSSPWKTTNYLAVSYIV